MSYLIHHYNSTSEEEIQAVAVGSQEVTIGAGRSAGLQLTMTVGMPEVCGKVWVDGEMLVAENVLRKPGLIFVNGQGFVGAVQLEHGDVLQIGNDLFAVVFDPDDQPEEVQVEAPIRRLLERTELNSALAMHTPVDERWGEQDFLENLCEQQGAFLFANFKFAGLTAPDQEMAGDDLYSEAPAEVRESYSLHALTQPSTEEKLKLYEELCKQEAAIWVVPEVDSETAMQDAKLYLAWLARPSVLNLTLQNSPDNFCEGLLKPFKAIILKTGSSFRPWAIYTKATFDPAKLGICNDFIKN